MKGLLLLVVGVVAGVFLSLYAQVFVFRPQLPTPVQPSPGDVQILLRNDYLTRQLNAGLSGVSLPVPMQGLKMSSQPDKTMVLSADFVVLGQPLAGQIVFRPSARDGRVGVQIVETWLGSLRLPPQVGDVIEGAINDAVGQSLPGVSFRVVGLGVNPDGLLVDLALPH